MAKLSKNISHLVFRRNIPFTLETYVLNCEMLQVLAEMDGIKSVAAIAAKLNRPVRDLVTTFATLYQQKLIFQVKPNPAIITQPTIKVHISNESKISSRVRIQPTGADIYRITKSKSQDSRRVFHPISAPGQSEIMCQANSGRPSLAIDRQMHRTFDKAAASFRRGVALLQRCFYQEALRQFELTLELDPQNKSCRANIHRLRKMLKKRRAEALS